ncbi:integration host factor subunit beta [Geobacter sp. FeAm09]|uniref:HU family DNA-binding protein n=1 Tax=Geobacter sp. FeAm09 TaxID=2597769 RepID=UPI0011ED51F9|nr:HU family DNA-binding protein [Geobacter sp. FeAm09]QEM68952.1 integration host factor subunit beta [Geobacter sp. FeAm09]
MNKSGLITLLAMKKNISRVTAQKVVDDIFNSMAIALVAGERIEIRGFGNFVIRDYASYSGTNPRTGASIIVKPKKVPFFKVGKDIRERIMKGQNTR